MAQALRLVRLDTSGQLVASGPDVPFRLEVNGRVFSQDTLQSRLVDLQGNTATYQVAVPEWKIDLLFRFYRGRQELIFTIPEVKEGGETLLERLKIIDHRLVSGLASSGDSFLRHGARRLNWSRSWCPGTGTISQWEDWGEVAGANPEFGPHYAYHAAVWNDRICAAFWCSIHIEPLVVELSEEGHLLPGRSGRISISPGTWYHRLRGTPAEPFKLRIALLADYNGDGRIDWADAAAWEGDNTYHHNPLYHEAIIYKLWLDSLFWERPRLTFADCLPLIQRLHRISGGVKQIIHLFGWQNRGHDTGFPCHNEFNPRMGSRKDLIQLIEQARDFNCIVSLHANLRRLLPRQRRIRSESAQPRSRRPESVVLQHDRQRPPTYSINHTLANESGYNEYRIEQMVQNLPLRESIHLDAHRPYNEVWLEDGTFISAECEIQRGMIPIWESFNRRGLDLSVEGTASEKRGLYTWAWIQPDFHHPYMTMLTHGRLPGVWRGGMPRDCPRTRIEGHALGLSVAQLDHPNQTEAEITAQFYLDWMYAEILKRKKMTAYRIGDWNIGIEAEYADETRVTAGIGTVTLEAWYEGIPIARGDDRFLPWREDTIFVFSLKGGSQEWTLPKSWDQHDVSLASLVSGIETLGPKFERLQRTIRIDVPPGIPLRLKRL